jgi:hypothetical protein
MAQGSLIKLPLGGGYHCLLTPGAVLPVKECKHQGDNHKCAVAFRYDMPPSPNAPSEMQPVVIDKSYVCRSLS